MQKVALILSLVGMAADIVIPFFAAKLVPGYSHKLQDMSALGSRSARSGRLYSSSAGGYTERRLSHALRSVCCRIYMYGVFCICAYVFCLVCNERQAVL